MDSYQNEVSLLTSKLDSLENSTFILHKRVEDMNKKFEMLLFMLKHSNQSGVNSRTQSRRTSSLRDLQTQSLLSQFGELILLKIFSNLPLKSLNRLKRVNKLWLRLINETLDRRNRTIEVTLFSETFNDSIQIVKSKSPFNININKHVLINRSEFIARFKSHLDELQLMIEPKLFVYFLTEDYFTCATMLQQFDAQKNQHIEILRRKHIAFISQSISSLLPSKSIKLFISCNGFINKNLIEYRGNEETNLDKVNLVPPIGGLLIPNNSFSYRFHVKQLVNEQDSLLRIKTERDLNKFFGLNSNESIRLIFLFKNDYFNEHDNILKKFITNLNKLKRTYSNDTNGFIFNGCSINDCFTNKKQRDYKYINYELTFLILISRKDCANRVNLAQICVPCINDDESTRKHNDSYINRLINLEDDEDNMYPSDDQIRKRKMNILKTNYLNYFVDNLNKKTNKIFAFQNITSKNRSDFDDNDLLINKESVLFRNYFPDIDLFGLSCYSQIGHDFLIENNDLSNQDNQSIKSQQDIFNFDISFYPISKRCCIFTLISLDE
jgi:hypothetical protein